MKSAGIKIAYLGGGLRQWARLFPTNLALSLSQLGTKYLNQVYYVAREVRDQATGTVRVPADYSELGTLLIVQMLIGLALPIAAIAFARLTRFKSA